METNLWIASEVHSSPKIRLSHPKTHTTAKMAGDSTKTASPKVVELDRLIREDTRLSDGDDSTPPPVVSRITCDTCNDCCCPTCDCSLLGPFFLSILLFIITLIVMVAVQTQAVYPHRFLRPENATLPDVFLDLHVSLPNPLTFHEVLVYGHIGFFGLFLVSSPRPITVIRRLLTGWSFVLLQRTLTIPWTSYPDPDPACASTAPPPVWWKLESCGDLMFSGHTAGGVGRLHRSDRRVSTSEVDR